MLEGRLELRLNNFQKHRRHTKNINHMFMNLLDQCSEEPNTMSKTSLQNQTRISHVQHLFNQPTARQYS